MVIGILSVILMIQKSSSLKDKRNILNSLKTKLRRQFNICVIESDDQNKWQKATLSIVNVDMDRRALNQTINRIINFIEKEPRCEMLDYQIQLI
jgi:uncharacterized protein YlxP (DUF503 family)